MSLLKVSLLASVLFLSPASAQNLTVGCGVADDEELAEFAELFTSDDSSSVKFRRENNLQRVSPPEIISIPDSATCERLAERATEILRAVAWDYWSRAEWITYAIRAGPYCYIYVAQMLPPEWVGGGWYRFVLDAETLEEIPAPYEFQEGLADASFQTDAGRRISPVVGIAAHRPESPKDVAGARTSRGRLNAPSPRRRWGSIGSFHPCRLRFH